MGVDASVMCNCYRDGKTKPCPFPDNFWIDEDGFPSLNLPYDDNENKSDEFDQWLATCCEHPNMDYKAQFIANWKGYRAFLDALEQIGWEQFPALHAELPSGNQGLTSAKAAALALKELEHFKTQGGKITRTFLINDETNAIVGSSHLAFDGMFGWNGRTGMSIGFDDKGFFIVDTWEMNRELFRAMRFEQHALPAESLDKPQQYEYIDLDSKRRFVCSTPVRVFVEDTAGQLKQEYPHRLRVEQRSIGADYFGYILEPLTAIFQASIETGNPVRWS
jgi:hypothetical protein